MFNIIEMGDEALLNYLLAIEYERNIILNNWWRWGQQEVDHEKLLKKEVELVTIKGEILRRMNG